jgi:iron complex outermembrane receptor protein
VPADPAARTVTADEGIEELVVRAHARDADLLEVPLAVQDLDRDAIQLGTYELTLAESLARVPGVFVQNRSNFAQDVRISIRGFGARANFGLRGIRLYVDGIPQTLPDGQGQVDSLSLPSVGRIEVMRGPASTLYGSAAGGVILVETETPGPQPTVAGQAAYGSFDYQNYDAKMTARGEHGEIVLAGARQSLDGYRDHAAMVSNQALAKGVWRLSDALDVMAVTHFVYSPEAEDPGGLGATAAADDPTAAWVSNTLRDAGESVWQVSSGLAVRRAWSESQETTAKGYFTWRDFDGRLPVEDRGQIDLQRAFGGASLQHVVEGELFERANRLVFGVEGSAQRDDRQRYQNLVGGERGALQLDQDENVSTVRAFVSDEWSPFDDVNVGFGLSYDYLFYAVDDALPSGVSDGSGRRSFGHTSPMASLGWAPREWANAYFRYGTAFQPPTTTELASESGTGFNFELEPQIAQSWEIGVKGAVPWRPMAVRYELAGYYISVRDELVPQDTNGLTWYANAGQTRRSGLELLLELSPMPGLTASFSYAYGVSKFVEFELAGNDFAGKRVPGIPDHVLTVGVQWEHSSGAWAAWETRVVSAIEVDDANTAQAASYVVNGLRAGWRGRLPGWLGSLSFGPYVGVDNVTNARYIDNVRINAFGGRYYEPAPALSAYFGARIGRSFGGS